MSMTQRMAKFREGKEYKGFLKEERKVRNKC